MPQSCHPIVKDQRFLFQSYPSPSHQQIIIRLDKACQTQVWYISLLYTYVCVCVCVCVGLIIWFNGTSTLDGYLMPNPIYTILSEYIVVNITF